MKVEYRLLNDLIAKALTAKAGAFDEVTQGRFDLMVAIMGGIRINWSKSSSGFEGNGCPIDQEGSWFRFAAKPAAGMAQVEVVEVKQYTGDKERLTITEAKLLEDLRSRAEVFKPAVRQKRTTIGRAAVRPIVPIQMEHPLKRKLILLEDSDSEDTKPLMKDIPVSTHVAIAYPTSSLVAAKLAEIPDDESLSLEELLWTLRAKTFLPSMMSKESITEIRQINFVPDDSFASIGIMIMDVLAEAHKTTVLTYLGLRKHHKLTWTLPRPSNLFSGPDEDTSECSVFSSLHPTVNQCTDLVVHPSAQFSEVIPDTFFRAIQQGQRAEHFCGFFDEDKQSKPFHSSSACKAVEAIYEDAKPALRSVLSFPLPPALTPAQIVLPVKICHHTFTTHMANQIKRRNVSSLTYENFPGGHPSQYCSHPFTLNSTICY
ncbi:hypothetical protein F511_36448 [Dorcoceras hygrometricum]|uniref:Uncharacterized protein n=1 Tax=Dorcoceras hygrometricum TaxID=472368 RepID=A0A2Z7DCP9_9LAMI|nr:hypothetical protein F511_36448 [Dorcoceras hygrometricum]